MSLFDSPEDERTLEPNRVPPTTMDGDVVAERGSLASPLSAAGVLPQQGEVPPQQRDINYADPLPEKTAERMVGSAGDLMQLDPDPTGDATVEFGKANGTAYANTDILSLNVLGKRMTYKELVASDEGRKLIDIARRGRVGARRDFFDAMNPLDWGPDKIPFVSLFATVGKSISTAKAVSDTFGKMQNGEPVTDKELLQTALYINEERERSQGTWGHMVGDIISQAPSFMAEFLASGGLLAAARKGVAGTLGKEATEGTVRALSHVGLERGTKILADETAEQAVKAGVKEYASKMGKDGAMDLFQAAKDFAANSDLRRDTVKKVADIVEKSMLSPEAAEVTGVSSWAPGVARKVAEARAEQAVAWSLAQNSTSSAVRKAVRSTGKVLADGVSRGLLDAGSWGTEASTVLFTDRSSAGRALADAINTFVIEAPLKGAELMLANKAVTMPISAALGGTVGRQELAIRQAAFMNNDEDLMNKAHAIGLGLDMLEYVSENTGRGFKSLVRAGLLKAAPKLAAPAAVAAGRTNIVGAKILREPSEAGFAAKGIEFSGLLEPGTGAETGGIVSKYVSKVLGSPDDIRATTLADRYNAVLRKLGPDVKVSNVAALESTIEKGVVQDGLDEGVKAAIGNDVGGFVKTALKDAYKAKAEDMKLRSLCQFYIADFMARHQIGPKTAMDLFERMGYDGIAGEMFEERYSDFVSGLFGLDAEQDHSLKARVANAVKGLFPGWDQLTAEAVGFAFPMVARAGTVRALNAIGGEQAYREYRENSALYMDAVRHGTVGQWRLGDLISGHQRSVDSENAKLSDAKARREKVMATRPADADEQWDRENVAAIDEEIARSEVAVQRLQDVHAVFMDSLTDKQRANMDEQVAYSPLTAEQAELPSERYNRLVHAKASQARASLSAATGLVNSAAKMGQTLYKMQDRIEGEDIGLFRKAAHWIVKSAGAMVTGDAGLMSMNPAQWHGTDVGLPETVQDALKSAYGKIYESELSADQRARAETPVEGVSPHEADMAGAHERALAKFEPVARQIMAADLAAHQVYMFSDAEMRDVAMHDVARLRDYAPDVGARQYVSTDGTRMSFADFYEANREAIDERRKLIAGQAFDLFSSGSLQQGRMVFSRRNDDSTVIADVIDIPRDLPTRDQAILATILKWTPGMRNILRAHEVDGNKPIDDQLGGMATRQAWLDRIVASVTADAGGIVTADAMRSALDNADKMDPVLAEAVARDLNINYDGTEEGLRERNRIVVRTAMLSKALQNPDIVTFSRDGALDTGDRAAAEWSSFKTARKRSDGRWTFRRDDGSEGVADSATLDAEMAKDKWSRVTPKVVFTSAQVLQSSSAHSMVEALGLKKTYVSEMNKRTQGDQRSVDPLYRKNEDGTYVYKTIEEANAQRERELALANLYISNSKQEQPHLYRHPGETDDIAATVRRDDARRAYYALYGDNGYLTVAHDVLRRRGVSIPMEGGGLSVGMLNADLRGKYVLSVNAFRSRNQSGNVYVPINHETAQNYESALLNAVCVDAYFKNSRILADVYESGIRNFVMQVDAIAKAMSEDKNLSQDLRDNLARFRAVHTFDKHGQRRMSPATFALFTSAFAMFRTECEGNLKSYLGDFAPALKAIAPAVRATDDYQLFLGAVDMAFGGSGFNAAVVQRDGGIDSTRGLARVYAVFAPTGSASFLDAIEKAAPGGLSATAFVKRISDETTAAWNSAKSPKARRRAEAKKDSPKGGVPKGLETVAAVQDKAVELNVDAIDELIDRVVGKSPKKVLKGNEAAKAEPAPKPAAATAPRDPEEPRDLADKFLRRQRRKAAELRSAMDAGDTSETVVDELRATEQDAAAVAQEIARQDAQRKAPEPELSQDDVVTEPVEDEVEETDADDEFNYVAEDLTQLVDGVTADADSSVAPVTLPDKADLTEAEMKALLPILGTMCSKVDGVSLGNNAERFVRFLNRLAPWLRRRDLQQFTRLFVEGVSDMTAEDLDSLWTWAEDSVEEGIVTDGFEGTDSKTVSALRSKALNNFLALASVVNPHTGRQFQAFVEDLRATTARGLLDKTLDPDVVEALQFVDQLVNPRANAAATPALRDAYYAELLDTFTDDGNGDRISRHVQALLRSDRPANRKAASLIGYLACMPPNVRRQMTQLVSSSAPSSPVRLNTDVSENGSVNFIIEPRNGGDSRLSVTAVSALYSSFAGRDPSVCVETADRLDALAKEMAKAGRFAYAGAKTKFDDVKRMFDASADLFAQVFGHDCPLVSVLSSKNVMAAVAREKSLYDSVRSGMAASGEAIPYIVSTVSNGLRYLAQHSEGKVSEETASLTSVLVNTMGDPTQGDLGWVTNTSRTMDRISTLFSVFDATMPRSIMTAEVNPERSNKPASSVAITMRGVEPAMQVFMDRAGDRGFRSVCERFFPEFAALSEELKQKALGVCRQEMCWPVAGRPEIVAKCLSKTAYAKETFLGCKTKYDLARILHVGSEFSDPEEAAVQKAAARAEAERKYGFETVKRFVDDNTFYVPVFSGDHSSSIIVAVPLASEFAKTMSYEEAAREVGTWLGLDILGVDAKRTALTCLEAPGVGFVGFRRDGEGEKVMRKRADGPKVETYKGTWTRVGVERDLDRVYLFGDNSEDRKSGYVPSATQAVIRGLPNAIGIDTKKNRGKNKDSYFTDSDFDQFKARVDEAIETAKKTGKTIVVPEGGIGTGKAELPTRAPKLYKYLVQALSDLSNGTTDEPETGECRVNILWSSEGGKNEGMIGSTLGFGYGVDQLKKCAKDPRSSTLKFHAMNTANTGKYGATLSLIKSLNVAVGDNAAERGGDFTSSGVLRPLMDFIRKQRSSDAGWSTSLLTDFDSVKLSLANSKMMGVDDGEGGTIPLMNFVFDRISSKIRHHAKLKDKYTEAELDKLVGEFKWVDKAAKTTIEKAKVSDILDGIMLERVPGIKGEAFSLSYVDNDMMGFQVANVSHKSKTEDYGKTPRNYMVDAMTMAQVLLRGHNADAYAKGPRPVKGKDEPREDFLKRVDEWNRQDPVFTDMRSAVERVQDLVASWGEAAIDVAGRDETKRCLMEDSEDAQNYRAHGEPENGRFMKDVLAHALATHLRKNITVPLHNIAAPLVANTSWIENNVAKTLSNSAMFADTLNGSRTIRRSERGFFRAHRRMAICNVNCSDASFRYGMYLESSVSEMEKLFADELANYTFESSDDEHRAVEILDVVFTKLRDIEEECVAAQAKLDARTKKEFRATAGEYADWDYVHSLRKRIASCFTDHHGNKLDKRTRRYFVTKKKEDGTREKTPCTAEWCDEVSYDDLFTRLTLRNGKPTFDRAAVYFGMHRDEKAKDAEGNAIPATTHVYLGGTMMGLPRTPSYNGSMWLQTVRAGLPVTERGDETNWTAGYDAMVAPDPFSLAILGCDHDGDKTNLYMLNAPSRGANLSGSKRRLADADRFLEDDVIATGDFSKYLERRVETRDKEKVKREWQVSAEGKMKASNTFVQGLFDMSRAMPVMDNTESEVPFYTGDVLDETTAGCMAPGTKAALVYKKLWESEITKNDKVIAKKILGGDKTIVDPVVSAEVGDGAKNAADARALVVSLASSLHIAWSSGLFARSLFRTGQDAEGAKAWLDFMHHMDGFSNMTFDDIKEQVCSRLGVKAGMMDTIVTDMINETIKVKGRPPRTDAEFVYAFARYAKSVNHGGSRAYMNRATDKGDYEMRSILAKRFGADPSARSVARLFGLEYNQTKKTYELTDKTAKYANVAALVKGVASKALADIGADPAGADYVYGAIVNGCSRDFSAAAGYVSYLIDHLTEENAINFVQWNATSSELQMAKSFARSVNYMTADPGDNSATSDRLRRDEAFRRVMYDKDGNLSAEASALSPDQVARLERMHQIVETAYRLTDAKTIQDYAASSLESYQEDITGLATDIAAEHNGDQSTAVQFAARLIAAERLGRNDVLQSQANAQMVGLALAAFRTVRPVAGSKMSSANAMAVLRAIADGSGIAAGTRAVDKDGNVDPNKGSRMLDMRRGVENMFELMYRLAMSSTVRDELPIFSYFSERNDSSARSFSDREYYGTNPFAENGRARAPLSRLTLAFQGVTEGQMTAVHELFERVVAGELDSKKRTDVRTKKETKFGFTLSAASLAELRKEIGAKDAKGRPKHNGSKDALKLVAEAESILKALEPVLGKGAEVTPSMMFGQILPLYAALTTRTDRTPDSRSSALVTALGDTYHRWARELSEIEGGGQLSEGARAVRMLTGVNWGLPNRLAESGGGDFSYRKPKRKTRDQFAKATKGLAEKLSQQEVDFKAVRDVLHATNQSLTLPRGRYLIDVFGNNELFESALEYLRDRSAVSSLTAPLPKYVEPTEVAEGSDPYVAELATRMGALLKMANGASVEYKGGDSFVIRTKLAGSNKKANGRSTAVRVRIVNGNTTDAQILDIVKKRGWQLSVATRAGVPIDEISRWIDADSTTDAQRIGLYRKYESLGHLATKTQWAVSAESAGVLANEILLKRQDGDPTVIYHEYFHSMMDMFRDIGALSDSDIDVLAKKYGSYTVNGHKWFNEEKAAYEFQEFVKNNSEPTGEIKGVFAKLLNLIRGLFKALVKTGVKSSDFGKDMQDNPLSMMVLTSTVENSTNDLVISQAEKTAADRIMNGDAEPSDIEGKYLKRLLAKKAAEKARKPDPSPVEREAPEPNALEDKFLKAVRNRKAKKAAPAPTDAEATADAMMADQDALNRPFGDKTTTTPYFGELTKEQNGIWDTYANYDGASYDPEFGLGEIKNILVFNEGGEITEVTEGNVLDIEKIVKVMRKRYPEAYSKVFGRSDEPFFWYAVAKKAGDDALGVIFPDRMQGQYSQFNEVARAVGMAIRNGLKQAGMDRDALALLSSYSRLGKVTVSAAQKAAAEEAVRKVAAVYGIDLGEGRHAKGSKMIRNLVYRAMVDVNSGAARYNGTDGRSSGPVDGSRALVTSSDLAGAILVSCGTQPCHLAKSARNSLAAYAKNYAGSTMATVIDSCDKALAAIERFDQTFLCSSNEVQEDLIGKAIRSLQAGLEGGMSGKDYELGEIGASNNPDHDSNIGLYGSHIGNPDFHAVMHRTLDTMYTILAGMKFYRQLGFEPGDAADSMIDPPAALAKSPEETAASIGVEARQMLDKGFDAIDFMDQPAFVANNIESYLESTVRSTFGKVPVGELMQGLHNRAAGFVLRLNSAENWLAALLGQNVLPGQRLHSASVVDGKFAMENGAVVAKAGGKHIRFELYRGEHENVRHTEDEHRLVDLVLKADKAYYQGAKEVVTGVDQIRFTRADSDDPAHYTKEEVLGRLERHEALSDIDRALLRLCDGDTPQLPAFITEGPEGLRERFVNAACSAMKDAKRNSSANQSDLYFSSRVLSELESKGILVAHEARVTGASERTRDVGTLVIGVDELERMFQSSTALDKLVRARRGLAESEADVRKLFSRESRIRPLHDIYREFAAFVRENPWLTDGDGAFFNNMRTPLAFVHGTGVFMYNANRRTRDRATAAEKVTAEEEKFIGMIKSMGENGYAGKSLDEASSDQLRYLMDLYGVYETSAESFRMAVRDGRYAAGTEGSSRTGLVLPRDSGAYEVTLAIYNRLVEAMWRENGDPVTQRFGGVGNVQRMIDAMEEQRLKEQSLTGGAGLTDAMCYRMNRQLPANHQLGHALHNQMEGIVNALLFRSTLVNMMMTPDEKGRPTVYVNPSAVAAEASGVPDQVWSTVARWWADTNPRSAVKYDEAKSGIENARAIYETLHAKFVANGSRLEYDGAMPGESEFVSYGTIKAEDIDAKSISGVMAQTSTKGQKLNFLGGGYALGYAKHLMQASRNLGSAAQRAIIHRALGWSKSMSVSFSFFFPLATKYESPWGAVGATAMLGSNHFSEAVRKNPEAFNAVQKAFGGKGWLTKDFLGFQDVVNMMDSNDPFLAELYGWASALGVSLSDAKINPIEPQRSVVQRDLANLREMVRDRMGAPMAARFDTVTRALLLRTGDKAFTYALNATKLATVAQLCMKLRAEAEEQGRAFDPVRDLKRYSGYINAEIGGIDPLKYAWAHPMNRGIMSMLMFSWEWTRGAWEAGGGGVIEDFLFGGHNVTAEERKYIVGRWARMFGGVMIGVPLMFQILVKAIAVAMGHDDDDEKWFTWQNEDKAMWTAFDITPLLKAMSEKFPHVAQWKKEHPALGALLPMYTGSDRANRKFGGLDPETGKTNGRHYYMHFGKQGWEEFRWFTDPTGQFFSKLSMPTQRMLEGIFGRSLSWLDHELPWNDMGFAERWLNPSLDSATANLVKAFLPFTLSGVVDRGDAGLVSAFGPIQMGASATATQDKIVKILKDWAYNDSRGYQPARPMKGKFAPTVTGLNSSVNALVREAMTNGASYSDAMTIVGTAVGRLTASLYGDLLDALPQTPNGDFDAKKVTKCVRAINRLGRKQKDVIDAINNRLKQRKAERNPALAERWNAIMKEAYANPYGNPEGL